MFIVTSEERRLEEDRQTLSKESQEMTILDVFFELFSKIHSFIDTFIHLKGRSAAQVLGKFSAIFPDI